MLLVAQSAERAERVPCVATLPEGWTLQATRVDQSRTRFDFSDGATFVRVDYAVCPPTMAAEPAGAAPAGIPAFEIRLPGQRTWLDQSANACLTAVLSGGDAARDEEHVEAVAGALRWIDRRRLDSTVASLTDGQVDTV